MVPDRIKSCARARFTGFLQKKKITARGKVRGNARLIDGRRYRELRNYNMCEVLLPAFIIADAD